MTFDEAWARIKATGTQSIMSPKERRYLWGLVEEVCAAGLNRIVKVGSAYGGTTALLGLAGGLVTSIDSWVCGQRESFERTLALLGLDRTTTSIIGDSAVSASRVPDATYGIVLVDGDHTGEAPLRDICLYAPKVAPGGYPCIDDANPSHPDVLQAVATWAASQSAFSLHCVCKGDGGEPKLHGFRRVPSAGNERGGAK